MVVQVEVPLLEGIPARASEESLAERYISLVSCYERL
jgi:hypothetical protein